MQLRLWFADGTVAWFVVCAAAERKNEQEALQEAHDEFVAQVRPEDLDRWMPEWRDSTTGEVN